jgi:hypothetical protein
MLLLLLGSCCLGAMMCMVEPGLGLSLLSRCWMGQQLGKQCTALDTPTMLNHCCAYTTLYYRTIPAQPNNATSGWRLGSPPE